MSFSSADNTSWLRTNNFRCSLNKGIKVSVWCLKFCVKELDTRIEQDMP